MKRRCQNKSIIYQIQVQLNLRLSHRQTITMDQLRCVMLGAAPVTSRYINQIDINCGFSQPGDPRDQSQPDQLTTPHWLVYTETLEQLPNVVVVVDITPNTNTIATSSCLN